MTSLRSAPGPLQPAPCQQDVWLFEQFAPRTLAHQVALVLEAEGGLDRGALRRAVQALVDRHEALRARFPAVDDAPSLEIDAERAAGLELTDFADLPPADREKAWDELTDRQLRRTFDLAAGPLARFHLVRLAADRHRLLIVLHHIVADDQTLVLLHRDLVSAYAAAASGTAWTPAGRSGDLRLLAEQVRAAADAPGAEAALERRAAALSEPVDPAGQWPAFGRQTPEATDPYEARAVPIRLTAPVTAAVRSLAAAERITPYMVWIAVLAAVLQELSDGDDLTIGTVIGARLDEWELETAGFFANVAALRVRLPAEPSWREVLGAVRDAALDAFEDADVPFRRVVERVNPERRADAPPVFQVLLGAAQTFDPSLSAGAVGFRAYELLAPRSLYPVEIQLRAQSAETVGYLRYQTRFLDPGTAAAVAECFAETAAALAAGLDAKAHPIPLPSGARRRPEPTADRSAGQRPDAAPNPAVDEVRDRVAAVWQAVLDLPPISPDENYFALGGNSLGAVRIASRLSAEFGVAISARTLFNHPTVAGLAAVLAAGEGGGPAPAAGPAGPVRAVRRGDRSLAELLAGKD